MNRPTPGPLEVWTPEERSILRELDTPAKIQCFLDSIRYSTDPVYRSPRSVLRDRKAHCLDGALFAAAALRLIGHPPRIVDMKAVRDDDHLLAIFKRKGRFGAVAKSNFVGLRFREPIYRSLRELVISYFDSYYNLEREKTLRGYTVPLDLTAFDELSWMTSDDELEKIADKLDHIPSFELLDEEMVRELSPVDERTYNAGMQGADPQGIYRQK
ncbi:MAG: hypothetical protein EHM61_16450 [Acidobacteria bacterium]|nr:MAG: hypothetical protein EHM61_28900 [Acidobacteriota bacterium]RPI24680.1 MAG: hypothetical protein EHM61_16450 [Acidobacteriota bacterium]